jgi:hypothetical protein
MIIEYMNICVHTQGIPLKRGRIWQSKRKGEYIYIYIYIYKYIYIYICLYTYLYIRLNLCL